MGNKGRKIRGSKAMDALASQNKWFVLNARLQQLVDRSEEWSHIIRAAR